LEEDKLITKDYEEPSFAPEDDEIYRKIKAGE
jgi:hypothetical protein